MGKVNSAPGYSVCMKYHMTAIFIREEDAVDAPAIAELLRVVAVILY
jgi:hypothetical protein